MGNDLLADFSRLLSAFLLLSAGVIPVAAILWAAARPFRQPLPTPHRGWGGIPILLFFLLYFMAMAITPQALDQAGVFQMIYGEGFPRLPRAGQATEVAVNTPPEQLFLRGIWSGLVVAPALLGLAWFTAGIRMSWRITQVSFGLAAWFPLTALTFLVYLACQGTFRFLNIPIEQHPLTKLTPAGDGFAGLIFTLSACVAAPIMEELLFRGLLIPWAMRSRLAPWLILGMSCFFSIATLAQDHIGPTIMGLLLIFGLIVVRRVVARYRPSSLRTISALWSSAALFALVHSNVWPTPIPLFVLGFGLGALFLRAGTIIPAILVHGLFNAVSTLYLALNLG